MKKPLAFIVVILSVVFPSAADQRELSVFGRTKFIGTQAVCSNTNTEWCIDGNMGTPNHILGTISADPLRVFANNGERIRVTWLASNPNIGRVAIPQSATQPILNPRALLHLGADGGGFRSWMDVGTYTQWDSDHIYVGLKARGGSNAQDAVISWGDDPPTGTLFPPDALRFIFTAPLGTGGPAGSLNGLEVARMMPNGNVGIGNFATIAPPQNRLDVQGSSVIGSGYAAISTAPANGLLVQGTTGIGTATPSPLVALDVNGFARVQNLTGGPSHVLVTAENGSGSIPGRLHSIAFTGNANQVLRGNGTFGAIPASGADNDWLGAGTGNMYAAFETDNVSIGGSSGLAKLNVRNNGTQFMGGSFTCDTAAALPSVVCLAGSAQAPAAGLNIGVLAEANGNGQNFGVEANALKVGADTNIGIRTIAKGGTSLNYAIWAEAPAPGGGAINRAGFFNGDVRISGTLAKSAGSFEIDHPLDPENRYLVHSFVESPDMMNIYNGNVTTDGRGEAWVELPSYFEALNKDFRYQLTPIGAFAQAIIGRKVEGSRFLILTDKPGIEVSWQVTGIRKDPYAVAHPIIVEPAKEGIERGRYLHPELYNAPRERGMVELLRP